MGATFESIGTLRIDHRRYAIFGNILAGELASGQTVAIPLNESTSLTLKTDSVEFVDWIADKTSYVALTFHKLDSETVDLLESLSIGNETLAISG